MEFSQNDSAFDKDNISRSSCLIINPLDDKVLMETVYHNFGQILFIGKNGWMMVFTVKCVNRSLLWNAQGKKYPY
jgi:hypothetical protein